MIYLETSNKTSVVEFEGTTLETPRRIGFNKIITTRGNRYQEFQKGVIDLKISLDYLDEENYKLLKLLFLNAETFTVYDEDIGVTYKKYLIDGESLDLTKTSQSNQGNFYSGNLSMIKV